MVYPRMTNSVRGSLRSNLPVLILVDNPVLRPGGGESSEGLDPCHAQEYPKDTAGAS